jgi:hypothetical protein
LEFKTKLIEFWHFVTGLCQRNKYSLNQIGNANETAIFFNIPRNYTVNFKWEEQVAMKTTGYEKLCVIVMLCITADGNKLPPCVILNRKTVPKGNYCKDVIVQDKNNAWMTSKLMEEWLECVLECQPGALSKPRSILAMDAFHGHLSKMIRNRLRNKSTDLVIIPSGI